MVVNSPENIERQEEKESSSVYVDKVEASISDRKLSDKGCRKELGPSRSWSDNENKLRDYHTDHIQNDHR